MEQIQNAFGYLINYTTRRMRRFSENYFRKHKVGITLDQWGLIQILWDNGHQLNLVTISTIMSKDPSTLTNIVDILCRKELTKREFDVNDRRKINIVLTEEGKKKVLECGPIVSEVRQRLGQGLSKKDMKDLERILGKINNNIDSEG